MISLKLNCRYDSWIDILDLVIDAERVHDKSVEITEGIYIDFDKRDAPYSIELVGASQILDMKKEHIPKADIKILMEISHDSIKFEITRSFIISKKKYSFNEKWSIPNDYGISQERYELSTD